MLFWEDQNLGDADYNDMAVEIIAHPKPQFQERGPQPVPEPTTAVLGVASLCGLGLGVAGGGTRNGDTKPHSLIRE